MKLTRLSLLFVALGSLLVLPGCARGGGPGKQGASDSFEAKRLRMVEEQIEQRGVSAPPVLAAMRKVPRHLFVPEELRNDAYGDFPLPIGSGQTISQPYIVALMTELLRPGKESRVLEIGTGSGYQAAVLAEVAKEVYSIEILPELSERAGRVLKDLGYGNVHLKAGDGYLGWPEHAPFDAIMVTAAPDHVPEPLKEQLAVGGRLVLPVGDSYQELVVLTRTGEGFKTERGIPVRFVPMTGKAREKHEPAPLSGGGKP